ncbi:hypothetical protein L228DRAFT_16814 [Xylona heveae TC161]|uniref:Uncharacterized protein n=1 Tax=Xylona heveae (strain CBS 132557 / TC161) TaxID=1328760 RepID=A0A165JVI1_XYLHT|nr:hypothetical protein L228DRAFT_16814 [Xylona heveae TC161]KZF26683.1 hypothetical protein L228DRAFT_16814 [Xylona heveae TC161]
MTRLQQRRKMDVSELCMATCALCSAIEVFTASSVLQLNGRPEIVAAFRNQQARSAKKAIISATFNAKRMEDTETAFRCLYRMVPNILKSLDKIGENPDGAHQGGQVAHALIHLFSKFLDYIHSVSLTQAEQAKKKKTARRKTQNAEQCPHNQNGISSKDDFQGQISHFLVILFSCLDMKRSLHSQLLEGLAFVLLSRVGKLLCTFVFDEEYDRDHQSEKTSPRPHINGKNKSQAEIENLARQKDAYYLVVLLKQILPLLGCQSEDVTHQSSRGILVQNAQRRLQSTLVNAIFGSGHEAFQDCFRLPALPKPASSINTPGSVIYDGTEWFQQEIWSLVGWQILCELDDDEDETGHSAKHCESLSKI